MGWMILSVLFAQTPPPAPPPQTPAPRAPVEQVPVRDPKPRTGTGVIAGRVIAVDTGLPLRRAIVTLFSPTPFAQASGSGSSPNIRSVATDAEGKFEFGGLPTGSYRLRAQPAPYRQAYLNGVYGGRGPRAAGLPIELKDRTEVRDADIMLGRGGAIVGRVLDEFGEPAARVQVYAALRVPGAQVPQRTGSNPLTDDLGRYRVFGLEPGEYYVAADGRSLGGPPIEGETESFLTTYFPAAVAEKQAAPVRVEAGAETAGVDIQLARTRTFRISGMVVDSQGRPTRASPELVRMTFGGGASGSMLSLDASGKFTVRDVVPGDYRLVVRPNRPGWSSAEPQPPVQGRPEFANMPITVTADMDDIIVSTAPGLSVTGQVVFAEPPATPLTGLRITTQVTDRVMMLGPPPTAPVGKNLQFTLTDIFAPLLLRPMGLPDGYAVKAVLLGSTDISDTPTEFKAEDSKRLQIILTSRVATLDGTVTGDGDRPPEAMLLLFPEDRERWTNRSLHGRTITVGADGKFALGALLPGTYYAVALAREGLVLGPDVGPEFYEPLTRIATTVVLGEGEKRTIDLRVMEMPEVR